MNALMALLFAAEFCILAACTLFLVIMFQLTSISWLGVVLLVVLTGIIYLPALHGGFILDDDKLITDNSLVNSAGGLSRIWFSTEPAEYYPISYSLFWLEWRLWGMNPTGYHVTNLVLHIAAALLIWAVLRNLSIPGAWLGALLFAVHPINVESVAWIAQLRNALAMPLFLLSVWCYLRADGGRGTSDEQRKLNRWYWLSLLAFLSAMLSKGSVAVLPLVLLLIVWWRRGRIARWDWLRTIPFFLIAIPLTYLNLWFQNHGTAYYPDVSFGQRLAGAGAVLWFYLGKALLPIRLLFVYPSWQIDVRQLLWWLPLTAALLVSGLLLRRRNSVATVTNAGRAMLFAWAFFCLTLAPVLGLTNVGFMRFSRVANHYQHMALIALVALAAAAWSCWQAHASVALRKVLLILAATAPIALGYLTWQENRLYGNPIALYQTTLASNPESWLMHIDLAAALNQAGRPREAIQECLRTLQLKPDLPQAYCAAGNAYQQLGQPNDAIENYRHAIDLNPRYAEAHFNLGVALAHWGKLPEAIAEYEIALKRNPRYAQAASNLGIVLLQSNRPEDAVRQFEAGLRMRPDDSGTHVNLAAALAKLGRWQEAIEHYQTALHLDSGNLEARANMAIALVALNRRDEAIAAAEEAIRQARLRGDAALAEEVEAWIQKYRAQSK